MYIEKARLTVQQVGKRNGYDGNIPQLFTSVNILPECVSV
jgi:hypothetical protein